jgi:hypothetical protein
MLILSRRRYTRGQRVFLDRSRLPRYETRIESRVSGGTYQCHVRIRFAHRKNNRYTWDIQRDSTGRVCLFLVCRRCRKINDISGHGVSQQGFTNTQTQEFCIECVHCSASNYAYLQGWDKVPDRDKRGLAKTRARRPARQW